MVRAHAPRPVLKRQTSQVRNTKPVGHAQPKRMAIERVSPLTCDGSLVLLPWEAKAQATFNAQPVATAIAAAARPFKWERDLTSQKSTTGSRRAVSNRAVVANFFMMNPNHWAALRASRRVRVIVGTLLRGSYRSRGNQARQVVDQMRRAKRGEPTTRSNRGAGMAGSGGTLRRLDITPLCLLQNDAIAIAILIGAALCFPVWIECSDLLEPSSQHPVTHCLPLRDKRYVEDCQVFNCRRGKHRMGAAMSELKVIAGSSNAKHHAVEAFVVFESSDDAQTQPPTVHFYSARNIANWLCNT